LDRNSKNSGENFPESASQDALSRMRITVRGAVQGVGFRPFVYRLATELKLKGWVKNSAAGALIEIEGPAQAVEQFLLRLEPQKPPHSFIQSLEYVRLDPAGHTTFEIRHSDTTGPLTAIVLPDIATCPECLKEMFDPANRRYRYPFTNCTHCGPRFSIIEALPYDRPNTTMRAFVMCAACQAEYDNPEDRRFHAQPNACPVCGPHVEFWDPNGRTLASRDEALAMAEAAIKDGKIVAVKGLGGFHLMVDARQDAAVRRLRERKHREEKPLALMFPDLDCIAQQCEFSELERRLLQSPESPIVLLRKRPGARGLSDAVAPGNPNLGVMLPYTPLHHLLLADLRIPLVATSGNISDEPICISETEALHRLAGVADAFLVHNRPIARHVDDSIARLILGREQVLRRARGYAPLPLPVPHDLPPLLAVGAHLKNAIAVAIGRQVVISQHIGDLETAEAWDAFKRVASDLPRLWGVSPKRLVCDSHPDYLSTQFARDSGKPFTAIQHHAAHVAACAAENEIIGPVLGVSWDGTGYGLDSTVWGGEFIRLDGNHWERVAHLRLFPLPGGDAAIKEPRRVALGILFELMGQNALARQELPTVQAFTPSELKIIATMLSQRVNCPLTSSAGRLFDAVSSLIGLRQKLNFEGQAAMELEAAATAVTELKAYPFSLGENRGVIICDWMPMFDALLKDISQGLPAGVIAGKFHAALAELVVEVARKMSERSVVLTGGCYQNRLLTELTVARLRAAGFTAYWHQRVPPNDGGIAFGQAVLGGRP